MKEIFKSVFAIMLSIFFVSGCAPERDSLQKVTAAIYQQAAQQYQQQQQATGGNQDESWSGHPEDDDKTIDADYKVKDDKKKKDDKKDN